MSKTNKFIPDLRVRRPYKREPKVKIPPYVPFDLYDEDEDTDVDDYHETADDRGNRTAQSRSLHRR